MPRVTVTTGSRLHFGLNALGDVPHAFGGVGAMVETPGVSVEVVDADRFGVSGKLAKRAAKFARIACDNLLTSGDHRFHLKLSSAPPEHSGLGLGTQLGLAVAAAIDAWANGKARPVDELALVVGRGRRSAIGVHGFERGGLILDGGHAEPGTIGLLKQRVALPEEWRVLLITPPTSAGLSGGPEAAAFARLPPIPTGTTDRLRRLAVEMIDSALHNHFDAFAESLGAYGRLAGECFAPAQGGAFASEGIASLVAALGKLGGAGAGQSSWGPTVFVAARSPEHADELSARLRSLPPYTETEVHSTRFSNRGARVTVAP